MWLLNVWSLQLRSFELGDAPQYAILSHTWGEEEISFQDLTERANDRNKLGWKKILGMCELCKPEPPGLNWVWIDTCCIDKASSAELSESINSMFAYYNRSSICIAYLEDVSPHYQDENGGEVSNAVFGRSRWFTRGWTLQELIAPVRLAFCSQDWSVIGDKNSLRHLLHSITLIDLEVLIDPCRRDDCSIAQRMSWASKRETTRPEDEAYSLMGIFSVNMPLLYGEGGTRAFLRLQQEILKDSTDHSLFTWTAIPDTHFKEPSKMPPDVAIGYGERGGLLAYSPREFAGCGEIRVRESNRWVDAEPYDMTNVGLRIRLPTIELNESEYIAILDCSNSNHDNVYLGIRMVLNTERRKDGKAFERLLFHKPVNVKVEQCDIIPGGDTYTVLAQAPEDCLREVKFRMMYVKRFRWENLSIVGWYNYHQNMSRTP